MIDPDEEGKEKYKEDRIEFERSFLRKERRNKRGTKEKIRKIRREKETFVSLSGGFPASRETQAVIVRSLKLYLSPLESLSAH